MTIKPAAKAPLGRVLAERVSRVMTSRRWGRRAALGLTYLILAALGVLVLLPFLWMLSTSLKDPSLIFDWPPRLLPQPVVWRNYPDALKAIPFLTYLRNTVTVTLIGLVGSVVSSSLAAYSFARLRWPFRDAVFFVVLMTLMLPHQVTLIPQFVIFRNLQWIDTLKPLIVPSFFGGGAFNIFLLRQFFMTIHLEYDDAARIDGCGRLGIFFRILMPMSVPAVATVAIFGFQARWNDFFSPLIYLNRREHFTLALGLRTFQNEYGTQWHYLMAVSVLDMLPILALFYFTQRYLMQGIVVSGIKG